MNNTVILRAVIESDLPIFFEQQRDPAANHMAAFTSRDPNDRDAFMAHWTRILGDEANITRTIVAGGEVAGNIASFLMEGEREVGYWLGKPYWGRGIASAALRAFLGEITLRPLHARAAKDNAASLRVLQKCGFSITGEGSGYAEARHAETEEYILTLR
ncbi:MAG TPA: GNAT family N-acetyltransferase [Ktedonobacterales bacterium]|nr:GNAT family N-acetyltransferase [Ktedonobacterales bacterium]